jgi:hypothetical protein
MKKPFPRSLPAPGRTLAAILVLALLSAPVWAQSFHYTYVGGGFASYSPNGGSSGNGLDLFGSYNFNPHFNFLAGYEYLGYGGGVSANNLDLGVGFHTRLPTRQSLDFIAEALFLHDEFDVSACRPFGCIASSTGTSGFEIAGGVRWHPPLRRLEIDGLLGVNTFGSCTDCPFSSAATVTGEAQYYFLKHLSGDAAITVGTNNYGNQFTLGVTYYFFR